MKKPEYENEILSGIYLFDKEILKFIPKNKYYGIDQLINKLIDKKVHITKKTLDGYWLDIGEIQTYEKVKW